MPTFNNTIVAPRVKELTLDENFDGELQSGAANLTEPITITGTGFGSAPTILLFAEWMSGGADGETVPLTDVIVGGDFDSGSYINGLLPKYFSAYGKTGISQREGGALAASNRNTGFIKDFPAPILNWFAAYESCVPTGKFFPAATIPNSTPVDPTVSSSKPLWLTDGAQGSGNADVVLGSWNGFFFVNGGNNVGYNLSGDANFDFAGWNSFSGWSVAGANPAVDNADLGLQMTSSAGSRLFLKTNAPAYLAGTPTQITRVNFPAWSGNPLEQDNTQLLYSYVYIAGGNDNLVKSRVELINAATSSAATARRIAAFSEWSDTEIVLNPSLKMREGMTHYRVVTAAGGEFIGALP